MWTYAALPAATCAILVHDVPQLAIELPVGKVMLPEASRLGQTSVAAANATTTAAGEEAAALAALVEQSETRGAIDASGAATHWLDERSVPPKTPVWRAEQVIAHASVALMRRHAPLFLGIQEVQWILDQLAGDYPGLVAEVQKVLPPQRIADVLRRLLEEQISIRNVRTIMESLITWGPKEKDMLMLTEYVRGDLSRFLAHRAAGGERTLAAVLFDMPVEQHIRQAIKQTPTGNFLALPPDEASLLIDKIQSFVGLAPRDGVALVTSMDIRRYVRRMIEARLGWLAVYSYQELGEHVELRPLGRVSI